MNRFLRIVLVATSALLAGTMSAYAQLPQRFHDSLGRPPDNENAGLAIEQVGVLLYPSSMLYQAIYSGEARVVISVDEKGMLTDYLVTGYTEEEFAKAAVMAIKRWKYQPALVRGEPRLSRAEVIFEFRDRGVIVSSLPGAMVQRVLSSAYGQRYAYAPCQLRELDQIPTPIHVVSPAIEASKTAHEVTVGFFIDEEGKVRMPAVNRSSADDYYAAAAVAAVEQWRFNPPLRKGRPVLVYAEQVFNYLPKS
jgi:TonB family protein